MRSPYDYSNCSQLAGAAIPKKTKTARFKRTISSSVSRPTRARIFVFGTVVILSTTNRQTAGSPLAWLGSIGSRNRGATVGSVVNAHRHGIRHVETVVLEDYSGTGLSRIVFATCNRPNFPALQRVPRSETASIKSWSTSEWGLLATARDWRCASAAKVGDRMSGTQI